MSRHRTGRIFLAGAVLGGLLATMAGCGAGGPSGALVGVWRAQFVDPTFGAGTVDLILMQDGTFQQQTAYQAGSLVTIYGTYRVFEAEGLLRLDIERGEPAEACGPLGCTDIIYPAGESYGYSLVDANTLVLRNINCVEGTGAVCTFNYGRTV